MVNCREFIGLVVGDYTQLSPSRTQLSSPFSFCSGQGSDLSQELWAQGSGPSVQYRQGIVVRPHPAHSYLVGEAKWKQIRGQCTISDG